MADIKSQDELIAKAVEWTVRATRAISDAGGNPEFILKEIPDRIISTMIRNDIQLVYTGDFRG